MIVDLKVVVKNDDCEDHLCYVSNPRESDSSTLRSKVIFHESFAKVRYYESFTIVHIYSL